MSTASPAPQPVTSAELALPRPPGVIRRAFAAHPLAVDITIVVWYLLGSATGIGLDLMSGIAMQSAGPDAGISEALLSGTAGYLAWPWWPFALIRIAVVACALLWRRKYPLQGLIAIVVFSWGDHGFQSLATGVAMLFLLYAVPVYRSVRAGWLGYGIAVLGSVLPVWLSANSALGLTWLVGPMEQAGTGQIVVISIMNAVWYLAILMLGINLGNRRRYLDAIIGRAAQLVRERDQLAQLAVAEERSRISREMHDIVSHSLTVMITLSEGAARAAATAPEAASEAMRKSAETGRDALAEMRRLLGALRDDTDQAEMAPQPTVADLVELVQDFRDAGLTVGLRMEGQGTGDRAQELAVYRAVQEGLTNSLRYAGPGARVEVTVRSDETGTDVHVRDFGRIAGESTLQAGIGSGRGLAGLAERARLLGGDASSGPAVAGAGWELRARLPARQPGAQGAQHPVA